MRVERKHRKIDEISDFFRFLPKNRRFFADILPSDFFQGYFYPFPSKTDKSPKNGPKNRLLIPWSQQTSASFRRNSNRTIAYVRQIRKTCIQKRKRIQSAIHIQSECVRVLFKYNCLFKLLKTVLLFEFKKGGSYLKKKRR